MNRSNAEEAIALLCFILANQIQTPWMKYVIIGHGVLSFVAAIYFGIMEARK